MLKGSNWDPCCSATGSAPRKKIFYQTSPNTLILIFNCEIHGHSLNICSFLKILKFSDFLGPKIAFRMKLKIFPRQNFRKKMPYKSIFPQKIDLVWNKIFQNFKILKFFLQIFGHKWPKFHQILKILISNVHILTHATFFINKIFLFLLPIFTS